MHSDKTVDQFASWRTSLYSERPYPPINTASLWLRLSTPVCVIMMICLLTVYTNAYKLIACFGDYYQSTIALLLRSSGWLSRERQHRQWYCAYNLTRSLLNRRLALSVQLATGRYLVRQICRTTMIAEERLFVVEVSLSHAPEEIKNDSYTSWAEQIIGCIAIHEHINACSCIAIQPIICSVLC